jgi:hypothetical protein|uniref:Uncharacterized protein n=1 Tax=viral metagenome TaxID=1070528 RepID=A0A6C0JX53_9ZZZZ
MKFKISPILIGSLAVFLVTPWVPNGVLKVLVGNPIGVFALLALTLVVLRHDLIDGLAFFLAAGVLFLENRKRILSRIEKVASGDDGSGKRKSTHASVESLSTPADDLIDGEVHPEHDRPSEDESSFHPKDDAGSNKFNPVDETINEKVPPETLSGSAGDMADKFVKDGTA